jgi:hypothetical protein
MRNEHIVARPTLYQSTLFRSRLEARWAAFFDLIEWKWKYEPIDFDDWVPDFSVEFLCGHSDCSPTHVLYAEVKPYYSTEEFDGHPVTENDYGAKYGLHGGLRLGIEPSVAHAEFVHGAGGGKYEGHDLFMWRRSYRLDIEAMWREAGNLTQWKPLSQGPCMMPGCSERAVDGLTNYCARHLRATRIRSD